MSRSIAATARRFGYRRVHRLKAAVAFVLVASIALGVIGLRGHGKALAQAVPPIAPAPFPQVGKYEFMMQNMVYFYFATDGRVVLQFPSLARLVLQPGEAEAIRQFAQQPPHPLMPLRIGRYFINVSAVLYWQNKDTGGATVYFSGCPSIDLTDEEAAHLRRAAREVMQAMAGGPGQPGAPAGIPEPAPVPVPPAVPTPAPGTTAPGIVPPTVPIGTPTVPAPAPGIAPPATPSAPAPGL